LPQHQLGLKGTFLYEVFFLLYRTFILKKPANSIAVAEKARIDGGTDLKSLQLCYRRKLN